MNMKVGALGASPRTFSARLGRKALALLVTASTLPEASLALVLVSSSKFPFSVEISVTEISEALLIEFVNFGSYSRMEDEAL